MIRSHRLSFTLILGIILFSAFPGYTRAQEITPPTKEEITALRGKAIELLESIAGQLNTLQSVENRARMGSNIMGSLWDHDETRARELLRLVQADLNTELQKGERRHPNDTTFNVFLRLRQDTVERIAKHDAEAALAFLKATEPVFAGNPPYDFADNEQRLELRLATQVASNNPDVALKLARQALDRGLSHDVLRLLARLNRKHKQQAQVLYKEIIERVRDIDFNNDWNSRYFAQNIIQSFLPPDVDEMNYRELVGVFVTKALENGCANKDLEEDWKAGVCVWIATIVGLAEKYDPRIARFKHWNSAPARAEGQELQHYGVLYDFEGMVEDGTLDELENLTTTNPDIRRSIYTRAIYRAVSTGNVEQAQKMIDRFITEPQLRQELTARVEGAKRRLTFNADKLRDIQKKLEEIPEAQGRAHFLLGEAHQFAGSDRKATSKLLDQASELIETLKPGAEQTQSRIALAMLYCAVKNDRGFAIMESIVPKLNELVDIAIRLDGYDTNYLRDGEWNMSGDGTIGALLTGLSHRAGYFAWSDFDRAVTLASRFERPEIRMMAHLKLAQSILEGPSLRP